MAKLADEDVRSLLATRPGWRLLGDAIHREFTFRGFRGSIAFVNRVAEQAEAAGHHPDLEIHYQRVVVSLSTHDQGGVTQRDLELAEAIDAVAEPEEQPEPSGSGDG
jgi:4a-hydroxytetrahydrobiopterin dehydratase